MLSLSVSSQNERDTHVDVLLVSLSGAAHPRVCSLLSLPAGHQACVYPFRSWREMRSEASKNRRYRLGRPPLGDNEEAWVVYTLCVCAAVEDVLRSFTLVLRPHCWNTPESCIQIVLELTTCNFCFQGSLSQNNENSRRGLMRLWLWSSLGSWELLDSLLNNHHYQWKCIWPDWGKKALRWESVFKFGGLHLSSHTWNHQIPRCVIFYWIANVRIIVICKVTWR